jgi:hypothetical protein
MEEDGQDVVMQEAGEEKRVSESPDGASETMGDAASTSNSINHKALPASIIPPNKASTAPSQEIIDKFAPGSAPHWVGTAAFLEKPGAFVKG